MHSYWLRSDARLALLKWRCIMLLFLWRETFSALTVLNINCTDCCYAVITFTFLCLPLPPPFWQLIRRTYLQFCLRSLCADASSLSARQHLSHIPLFSNLSLFIHFYSLFILYEFYYRHFRHRLSVVIQVTGNVPTTVTNVLQRLCKC